jgi:ABC-type uncharacterized transport system substrate-binding protein
MKLFRSQWSAVTNGVFGFTLGAVLFAPCASVDAHEPKKIPRIAYLVAGSASSISTHIDAFRQGLRDLGYVEGKNIVIEYRYAEGKQERLPDLAAELVQLKVDLIFTGNTAAALASKNATSTVPIVVALAGDPVANGVVRSLARPGGNVTGLTRLSSSVELTGKQLELLKEAFPRVSLVAVLWYRDDTRTAARPIEEMAVAAKALGVQLQSLVVRRPDDIEKAFSTITKNRADAIFVRTSTIANINEARIVAFAAKSRLPAMYQRPEAVDAGGLMYYGPDDADLYHHAAIYVDKILRGAKPADLPVEQPKKFEFIINLKAAKAIGLTIPPNVLARADRVIK